MKWAKNAFGDWIAQGVKGRFIVWKERGFWRGLYLAEDGTKAFRMPRKEKISEMKAMCQENDYWEEAA